MSQRFSSRLRDRVEEGFTAWGLFACRHPWKIILVVFALSGALLTQLPALEMDNSTDTFLRGDDPVRVRYDEFRREFGRDERLVIAIEAPDLFAPEFLERLRAFHEDLEREVPYVNELVSMINARHTRGEADELVVEDLMEEWPETPEQRALLRSRVLGNPLYRGALVSADATVTTVSIQLQLYSDAGDDDASLDGLADEFDDAGPAGETGEAAFLSEAETNAAVRTTREIVARHQAPGFFIQMAGGPVMTERLNAQMMEDMGRFTLLSIAAIASFLLLLFRRVMAMVLPLLVVGLSMLCTLGVMGILGGKLSVATQILPSFLLAVGVCDAVHILAIFYQRLNLDPDKRAAIAHALGHSGLAIVMTSLTTAGGLGSFAFGELAPVAELGVYAPVGVVLALIYTVLLMPPLLAVTPVRRSSAAESRIGEAVSRILARLGDFAATRPWSILSVTAAILAVSFMGIWFLRFSHDPMDWFPEDEPFRMATLSMDRDLDGLNVVEVLVRTGVENGVHEPDLLNRLDAVRRQASRIHTGAFHVGKTVSVIDVLKETHQALNENRPEFYAIPQQRDLVAQELLLFENSGSDDLADFVDPLFSVARVTMRVPWVDAIAYPPLLDDLQRRIDVIFDGIPIEIEMTGLIPVLSRTFRAMLESMARSYALAILVIVPLMVLLIGQLGRGLLSMIPNLTPVVMMLGFMGWTGMVIDGLTMMVGAIVIGLAVDDTIHFMHNFRRYHEQTGDARRAIAMTLDTTGRALLVTSLVLAAGFAVFTGAYMSNVRAFGLLSAGAILVAFVANVVLASALMVLASRRAARRNAA